MFLLKYTSSNSEGYYLVYATCEEAAIEKLKDHLYFLWDITVFNYTLE